MVTSSRPLPLRRQGERARRRFRGICQTLKLETLEKRLLLSTTVTGVYVSGSAWDTSFLNYLGANGGSATLGYAIPTGAAQLNALPWTGVDRISIQFSANVTISPGALTIVGVNQSVYPSTNMIYDLVNHVASWTLSAPVPMDKLLLNLNSSLVIDGSSNQLDGEWTNSTSTVSGNGTPGGDFNFRLNIAPGDVNNSQGVNSLDTSATRSLQGASTTSGPYSVQYDVNGSGGINSLDTSGVRNIQGTTLPAADPVVPPQTPSAPINLALVTNPGAAINLTWQNTAATSTNVIVQRSSNGSSFSTIATLSPTATSYLDSTGLSPDTLYYYRLYTTNSGVNSNYTLPLSDTTLPTFSQQTIWVDTVHGSDSNTGTFTSPYKTINKALSSTAVKNHPAGTGIILRAGTYTEQATLLSGSAGSPFTLMAEPNETAVISGFQAITGWTLYSGNIYSTTLNWNPDTLYVNFTAQDMARTPDQGWFVAPSVVQVTTPTATTTITDPTHLNTLGNLVGSYVQIHGAAANVYYSAQVTAQNTSTGSITFNTPSGAVLANNDFYIVKDLPSLISRPGEWAVLPNGSGGYTMYFEPNSPSDLTATQARFTTSRQILANNAAHDIVIRNLTVVGNKTGYGIDVEGTVSNNVPTFANNITVENNIVAYNGGNGIWYRYINNSLIKNNIVLANANGIAVADATNVTVDGNEVAFNVTDGIDFTGDVSGRTIGDAGFSPSHNDTISNNYIHDQLGYGHCDGIQMYRYVYAINVVNNVIRDCGQGIMTEEVDDNGSSAAPAPSSDWSTVSGNLIFDIAAYSVIFGHSNSFNWNVSNNTIGGSGYGPFNMTATGYNMTENIYLGKVGLTGTAASSLYTGDRNFYYQTAVSQYYPYFLSVSGPPWVNFSTVAAFYASQGQDHHSLSGDPGFVNAPAVETMVGNINISSTTSVNVNAVTGFAVGDYIEINHDGVARKITAINTSTKMITFDIPLPVLPLSETIIVDDWKSNSTNFNVDLRLRSGTGNPALTLSSTGGPVGSLINLQQYMAGDFNGDGIRDLPPLSAAISSGLPSIDNWPPPSF